MPRLSTAYHAVLRSLVDSAKINAVSWGAEALYVRLLLVADGQGRYFGNARVVHGKAAVHRAASSQEEIEGFLRELEEIGLVFRYGSGEYLQIREFFHGAARGEGKGKARTVLFPDPPEVPPVPPRPSSSLPVPPRPPDRGSGIGDMEQEPRAPTGTCARDTVGSDLGADLAADFLARTDPGQDSEQQPSAIPRPRNGHGPSGKRAERPPDIQAEKWAGWVRRTMEHVQAKMPELYDRVGHDYLVDGIHRALGQLLPRLSTSDSPAALAHNAWKRQEADPSGEAIAWIEEKFDWSIEKRRGSAWLKTALAGGPLG